MEIIWVKMDKTLLLLCAIPDVIYLDKVDELYAITSSFEKGNRKSA